MNSYVTDNDLKVFHPRILEYLPPGRTSYAPQITEAHQQVIDALRARGVKATRIGKPIDLNRPAGSTAEAHALVAVTHAASTDLEFVEGIDGFNRLVVAVASLAGSGTYLVHLEGANDLVTPPTHWERIASMVPTAAGEMTVRFVNEHRYYRLVTTLAGETPSLTFTAALVESYPDRLTMYKALAMISRDYSRQPGDAWDARAKEFSALFEAALQSVIAVVDTDESNTPEVTEQVQQQATFSR